MLFPSGPCGKLGNVRLSIAVGCGFPDFVDEAALGPDAIVEGGLDFAVGVAEDEIPTLVEVDFIGYEDVGAFVVGEGGHEVDADFGHGSVAVQDTLDAIARGFPPD